MDNVLIWNFGSISNEFVLFLFVIRYRRKPFCTLLREELWSSVSVCLSICLGKSS